MTNNKDIIGIIGSGMIGANVARLAVKAGLKVAICNSRGPETLDGLISELGVNARAVHADDLYNITDFIVLAVPFSNYKNLDRTMLAHKIVIDTMNYYPQRDGNMPEVQTDHIATSELIQKHLSNSYLVRALSNMDYIRLLKCSRPSGHKDRSALPIAGDHLEAKKRVSIFLDQIGYDNVDMGGLGNSWRSEPTMPIYVTPYIKSNFDFTKPINKNEFLSDPGAPVSIAHATELIKNAVRHQKMFGSLPILSS